MAGNGNPKSRQNLIKKGDRTPNERRMSARKAGKASGESRRLKKTLTESLKELCTPEAINEINQKILLMAKRGNLKAYELIRDGLGEKPTDKLEVTGNISIAETLKAARNRALNKAKASAPEEPQGGDDG